MRAHILVVNIKAKIITGPFVYAHTNLTEIDQTMDLMWRNNIDPSKITLGLGFYGRSFTLTDPSCTAPGCGFSAGGDPGPCTASAGTLSFAEIQDVIANNNPVVTLDSAAAVKIVVWNNNQWVSYDDEETLALKVQYANNLCLGGMMVWAGSLDDANGDAAAALSAANGRENLNLAALSTLQSTLTQVGPTFSSCQFMLICFSVFGEAVDLVEQLVRRVLLRHSEATVEAKVIPAYTRVVLRDNSATSAVRTVMFPRVSGGAPHRFVHMRLALQEK